MPPLTESDVPLSRDGADLRVGLEAYRAAGGSVGEDPFVEDACCIFLCDRERAGRVQVDLSGVTA